MLVTQSNTIEGPFEVLAGEDLTDKAGRLVLLTHDSGTPEVVLPGDVADHELYLLIDDGAEGERVTVAPLTPTKNHRIKLAGTCNPGDELTLGAVDGTDDGKVRKLPAAADDYFVFLIAEEAGVNGQLVLCRPSLQPRTVTVA